MDFKFLSSERDIAIDLLQHAGAVISSTEIVIFQWALRANTDDFRKILPIVNPFFRWWRLISYDFK